MLFGLAATFCNMPAKSPNEADQPRFDDITIFETEDGRTRVEVHFENQNVWLTQKLLAQLYECSADKVSLHVRNIFAEGERHEIELHEPQLPRIARQLASPRHLASD